MRVSVFIDGFNFYHALIDTSKGQDLRKYRWISYWDLGQYFAHKRDCSLESVYIFTAYPTWDTQKLQRHENLVKIWTDTGCKVVLGNFKQVHKNCNNYKRSKIYNSMRCKISNCSDCNGVYISHEEKKSDVNFSVKLIEAAMDNEFDTAVMVTADTDIIPAVNVIKKRFQDKAIGLSCPPNRRNDEFAKSCAFEYVLKRNVLNKCLLPDPYILKDGSTIPNPYK
jgi:uncharacterized LabA/DUF88 family protein